MSGEQQEPLELSEEAASLQHNGDLPQCVTKLKALQRHLMNTDRWKLSGSVLWNVCGVIRVEWERWRGEGAGQPSLNSLEVVSSALCCVRNAMPNCARNQLLVAETEDLLNPIVSCIQWTFKTLDPSQPLDTEESVREESEGEAERRKAYSTLAISCVTCLGNLVAANSKTRRIVWPYFKLMLGDVLVFWDKEVAQASTMILHNCLLEAELKEDLCKSPAGKETLTQLLTLYEADTKYSCFVLLALEVLLAADTFLEETWLSLTEGQQCLCLEVVEVGLTHTSKPLYSPHGTPILKFLVGYFKTQADRILRTHADWPAPDSALVLAKLVSFTCAVAASDTWRPTLQQDRSLLVTSVALLQCMHEIGKMGGNAFTPLDRFTDLDDKERMSEVEQHPAFGFKCDLIRLIASLVHLNSSNQDLVREMNALLLILETSRFDARNPLIKEASIFALRNLLEGNLENQRCIGELRMQGVAENPGLADLGMEAVQEGGKLKIVQQDRSRDSPPPEL
ncbi:ataxin-10-like [Portunus trituberculatus]|nr:ataxin-10-like [Portunus trituberculatus]